MASSSQSSSSYSNSEPVSIRTPENDLIDQLSGVAAGLAQQMYSWAQGVYAQSSRITDQAVGNFFNVSQQMLGLSNNLTDQYNNVFAPQNRSLAKEADEFNSTARQKLEMGKAGATAAMAGDQQLKAAEESLKAYGIDPSSGRYAALDKAAAVQNAAGIAGQMNQARDRTAETGRQLRSQAVQVGATLPAAIANVNNTAIQANTGASNAQLALANTGANLNRLPNEYLRTAMDIKLPPTGQRSTGGSQSSGSSNSPSGGGSGGGAGGGYGGGYGGGGGGPGFNPVHGDAQARYGSSGGAMQTGRFGQSSAGIRHLQPYDSYDLGNMYDWQGGVDPSWVNDTPAYQQNPGWSGDYNAGYSPYEDYSMNVGAPGYSDDPFQSYNDPWSQQTYGGEGSGFGEYANYDTYGGGELPYWGGNQDYNYDANSYDPGWDNRYDTPVDTDWGNGASAYSDYGQSGFSGYSGSTDFGIDNSSNYDTYSPSSDYYAGDYSGNYDDYGGVYASGGPIPASASPSGGAVTDDIPGMTPAGPARFNANEFVIPQDVALWKGQEFFQKLIDQSRMANSKASAKPKMQPM